MTLATSSQLNGGCIPQATQTHIRLPKPVSMPTYGTKMSILTYAQMAHYPPGPIVPKMSQPVYVRHGQKSTGSAMSGCVSVSKTTRSKYK